MASQERLRPIYTKDTLDKRAIAAWCLYDWANSAFATVIITFVFSIYFARGIVGDEVGGSVQWGYAMGISGLFIAVLGPVLGSLSDHYGARKLFLTVFSFLCIIPTALLWFAVPDPAFLNILFVLTLVVVANVGFELAIVFGNAMLPDIAPPRLIGRVSGWAWGLGYIGGLVCLVLALFGLIGLGDIKPLLSLPQTHSEHLRATGPLAAAWFAVFMVPLLLWTKDAGRTGLTMRAAACRGVQQLISTLRSARRQKNMFLFLISSMIYRDGLNTLFAIGGLYAAGTLGMSFQEILIFAIGLNVTAGLGAAAFAWMDDAAGSKRTILISLLGLLVTATAVLMTDDKTMFIALALLLGLFMGPVQSASRTMAARLSPPGEVSQTYGLYALTGKCMSFMGPFAFATATALFESQRAGMASILVFWIVGGALLVMVRETGENNEV